MSRIQGITISRLGEKGKPLKHFFDSLNEVTMSIVGTVMWYVETGEKLGRFLVRFF